MDFGKFRSVLRSELTVDKQCLYCPNPNILSSCSSHCDRYWVTVVGFMSFSKERFGEGTLVVVRDVSKRIVLATLDQLFVSITT